MNMDSSIRLNVRIVNDSRILQKIIGVFARHRISINLLNVHRHDDEDIFAMIIAVEGDFNKIEILVRKLRSLQGLYNVNFIHN